MLLEAITKHCTAPETKLQTPTPSGTAAGSTAVDGEEAEEKPLPLVECLNCLAAAYVRAGATTAASATAATFGSATASAATATPAVLPAVAQAQGAQVAAALQAVLAAQLPWQQRLAAIQAAQALVQVGANWGVKL